MKLKIEDLLSLEDYDDQREVIKKVSESEAVADPIVETEEETQQRYESSTSFFFQYLFKMTRLS